MRAQTLNQTDFYFPPSRQSVGWCRGWGGGPENHTFDPPPSKAFCCQCRGCHCSSWSNGSCRINQKLEKESVSLGSLLFLLIFFTYCPENVQLSKPVLQKLEHMLDWYFPCVGEASEQATSFGLTMGFNWKMVQRRSNSWLDFCRVKFCLGLGLTPDNTSQFVTEVHMYITILSTTLVGTAPTPLGLIF